MKTSLNEKFTSVGEIIESDKSKLRPGVLAKARYNICNIDELNRNKRIYERKVWEMVQENKEVKEKLENRCLYAHAEHPSGMQSSTEKIAGLVTEFIIDDAKRKVYNVMEVLDTPEGRIVETLLRAGCGIGVSTRAEGELEECISEGTGDKYYRVVPESYRYVTTDWTADPSTYGAYPEAVERDISKIVKEGLESKKIDSQYAMFLLDAMNCKEAVALRESIKEESEQNCKKCNKSINKHDAKENNGYCDHCYTYEDVDESLKKTNEGCRECGCYINDNTSDSHKGMCKECHEKQMKNDNKSVNKGSTLKQDSCKVCKKPQTDCLCESVIPTSETMTSSTASTVTFNADISEQGGSRTTGIGEIWKAFEIALNKDKSKELSESITNTEKTLVLVKEFKQLRETIAILEAENAKLAEISESDLISVRKNYIRDVKDFNKKINILQEELTATHEATQLRVTEITEKFNADKISLGESVRKEFEDTIASIEKAVLETTQKVYESKFKGLKETFTRELKELEENHNSKLMKILVRIKVREAGLDSELTPRHLTLLESCKSEQQIAAKLDEIRFLIKEGSFHSDDFKSLETPLTINVNETVTQEGKDLKESLGETLHLLKSMK